MTSPAVFPFPCRLDRAVIIAADAALVAARPLPEMRFSDAELLALLERYSHVRARVLRY
ncbi:hypothetical protein HYG77_31580 (plasmid) [Rhodococcus sp. ZPP]|uniref:hypothetical protein n=1 Tax=Rhodococcus sp. ZPP TaxID=2749906 RepID=UPI001AD88442|nr:hypothetical protein [Rhodococcus sp. ZPP]QTJ70145.1 hypothetical protein HYG77_31580 [Rhodococcus sp. ZPP]